MEQHFLTRNPPIWCHHTTLPSVCLFCCASARGEFTSVLISYATPFTFSAGRLHVNLPTLILPL